MRVSDSMAQSQYILNNASTLAHYLDKSETVLTQKKFLRASENPVDASMAMKIRKQLANLEMFDKNLTNASSIFTQAETSLTHISTTCYNNVATLLESIQSTKGDVEFEAIGNAIMHEAESMVKDMNADSGERQLFGGTSNNKEPFTYKYYKVDGDGNFRMFEKEECDLYTYTSPHGNEVTVHKSVDADGNTVYRDNDEKIVEEVTVAADGSPENAVATGETGEFLKRTADTGEIIEVAKDADGNYTAEGLRAEADSFDTLKEMRAVVFYNGKDVSESNDPTKFPGGEDGIYIDVGLGIKYDENGDVIPSTAMDISLNGAKLTGCGRDKDGDSKNLIQLAFDAAWAAYNSGDNPDAMPYANRLIDKLAGGQKTVLSGITELGIKQNNIDFHLSKDKEYNLNLSERQNNTEGADLTQEITNEMAAQAAYNAALRLGATAVPQSIFNYI